jgi:flavin reductase (DIM6/NTAB) family NADH-FMN oxidoreductase RutF
MQMEQAVNPSGGSDCAGAAVAPNEFRRVMGLFATGVTIVTIFDPNSRPYGFPVNAFSSVSLNPPEILICIDRAVSGHQYFRMGKLFSVHILNAQQASLCRRFTTKDIDRFEGLNVIATPAGAPLIQGVLVVIECQIVGILPASDHDIFLGRVSWLQSNQGNPLIFYGGHFLSLNT